MISRVTSTAMADQAIRHLQSNMSRLAKLQDQATSQRAFASPSADPAAAATALGLHADQRRTEQYARNIDDGLAWVTTVDSALSEAVSLLGRARDLTVQGANAGTMSPTSREAIAVELEGIRDALLAASETRIQDRLVFAGTTDAATAFDAAYGFNGVPGAEVNRRIADGLTVRVDADGTAVFGEGTGSVFALLDRIVADLRAGENVSTHLGAIDERRTAMLTVQGSVGARTNQLERAREATMSASVSLESRRAAVEDVDSVEVLVKLQAQELVYRSALAVTGRVLQPSLLEFLR